MSNSLATAWQATQALLPKALGVKVSCRLKRAQNFRRPRSAVPQQRVRSALALCTQYRNSVYAVHFAIGYAAQVAKETAARLLPLACQAVKIFIREIQKSQKIKNYKKRTKIKK